MKTALELVAEAKNQITEISIEKAQQACKVAGVIVDVREPNEYIIGHIPNAINIPRGLLEFKINEISTDTNIVLYCKTSGRGALSALTLQTMGYDDVASISGGFEAWEQAGFDIEKPEDLTNFG